MELASSGVIHLIGGKISLQPHSLESKGWMGHGLMASYPLSPSTEHSDSGTTGAERAPREYFDLTKNENIIYQMYGMQAKQELGGNV